MRSRFLLLALVWFVFCSAGARADILIAAAAPFSGRYIASGQQYRLGVEMAVEHLNESGGLLGHKVRLIFGDDDCNGEQAVAVAKKLVQEKTAFVVGHYCSGASIPASEIYEKAGVVMISPSSTNPQLTDQGRKNVFRVCGRDDVQGQIAGHYLAEQWKDAKIAILHDGSTYGSGLAAETKKALNEGGVREVLYQEFPAGSDDYSAVIADIESAMATVVYIGGYSTEAGLIARQASDSGLKLQLVAGDAVTTEDFWTIAGDAGEGTLVTFFKDPIVNPEAQQVVASFRERGVEPVGDMLYAYAAVQTWAQAVQQAGTLEPFKVIDSLHANEFSTVLGKISFDENGDVKEPGFDWYVWREGNYSRLTLQ
jgi:branched-chain amino acid transport system substrate-binding protein